MGACAARSSVTATGCGLPSSPLFTSAIAAMASVAEITTEAVIDSPANAQPRMSATIGFTYVCVATSVGG